MLASFLLSLREGVEAALIIGIVMGAVNKLNRRDLTTSAWYGVVSAILASLIAGITLTSLGLSLEGVVEQIFEGTAMLAAACLLTWMIFWMNGQSRHIKGELESSVSIASSSGKRRAIFSLAFLAVVREGIELALFLTAATFATDPQSTLSGSILGLGTAALLGVVLFATTLRLDLRRFFQVTGLLLILFSAGLVAHGIHEFNEAGWIPPVIEHLWNMNPFLDEDSPVGLLFKALFGYNGNPSLTEILGYLLYFAAIFAGLRRVNRAADPLVHQTA